MNTPGTKIWTGNTHVLNMISLLPPLIYLKFNLNIRLNILKKLWLRIKNSELKLESWNDLLNFDVISYIYIIYQLYLRVDNNLESSGGPIELIFVNNYWLLNVSRLVKGGLISINGAKNDIIQVDCTSTMGFVDKRDSFSLTSKDRFKVRSILIADFFACFIFLSKGIR